MATLSITENYADGEVLTEAELDAAFDSVVLLLNTTKLDTDNFQDNILTTAFIADGAITTGKFLDLAVTDSKLQSDASVNASRAVLTNHIRDLVFTTEKINDSSIGPTLRVGNLNQSSSSGSFSTSATAFTNVTNLSRSITVNASRDVLVMLVPDGSGPFRNHGPTTSATVSMQILRDASLVGGTSQINAYTNQYILIDKALAAGTYTYSVQAKVSSGMMSCVNAKLLVMEL